MTARGALIKPWIFREAADGYWDITAEERVGSTGDTSSWRPPTGVRRSAPTRRRRQIALDDYGRQRLREFLRWHVGFWVRYAPQRADGSWPTMQGREPAFEPRSALEALLARTDDAAIDYITDELLDGGSFEPRLRVKGTRLPSRPCETEGSN